MAPLRSPGSCRYKAKVDPETKTFVVLREMRLGRVNPINVVDSLQEAMDDIDFHLWADHYGHPHTTELKHRFMATRTVKV